MMLWLGLGAIALGLFSLFVTWKHSGLRGSFNLAEPTGLTLFYGVGFLLAGMVASFIHVKYVSDRKTLDDALVEMLGRAPDSLNLEGDSLMSFRGTAWYGMKGYKIKVSQVGMDKVEFVGMTKKTTKEYEITAIPLDAEKR